MLSGPTIKFLRSIENQLVDIFGTSHEAITKQSLQVDYRRSLEILLLEMLINNRLVVCFKFVMRKVVRFRKTN